MVDNFGINNNEKKMKGLRKKVAQMARTKTKITWIDNKLNVIKEITII